MPHAIIRGANGRRHEVDFGDAPVRVEIYASEETVEIFIKADFETLPEERRRFALLNLPRHLFSEATASAARRAANRVPHPRNDERFRIRLNSRPSGKLDSRGLRLAALISTLTCRPNSPVPSPKGTSDRWNHPPHRSSKEACRSRPPGAWPVALHRARRAKEGGQIPVSSRQGISRGKEF